MKTKASIHIVSGSRAAGWDVGISLAALLIFFGNNAFASFAPPVTTGLAQPFTSGNIVVEKFGDGTAALSSAGTPIYFDEISTSGFLVQTFGIPPTGSNAMVDSGTGTSGGAMTLSADGKSLVFPGYNTNSGVTGITSASSAAVPRGIGQVDAYGNYTLPVTSTIASSATTWRGAATDGANNYWGVGSSGTDGGIYYMGTASPTNNVYSANLRTLGIINGNLWYGTGSGTPGIGYWKYTGLPTTAVANTATHQVTTTGSPYNFSVNPGETILYYADDSAAASGGGIHKFTKSGGTWSAAYLVYTNPCFGLMVDWTTSPATIYATSTVANNNSILKVQDSGSNLVPTILISTGSTNTWYRNLCFVPTNTALVAAAPTVKAISPTAASVGPGTNVNFNIYGTAGVPSATIRWYSVMGTTTNLISGASSSTLALTGVTTSNSGSYFATVSNASGSVTSPVGTLNVVSKPTITAIAPASVTTNAGSTVTFTLTSAPGTPTATNIWYKVIGSTTNVISSATNTTLTLNNVLGGDSGSYFAVLTNSSGSATSSVVTLTVTNDPNFTFQPASTFGLTGGVAYFTAGVGGTSPSYQWYYSDTNGNIIAPVPNGGRISGASGSLLTISSLQASDPTNFVLVVTNIYGSITSSVASLLSVSNNAILAFWNFDQPSFPTTVNDPAPWYGVGYASALNCSVESGATDPADGPGFGLGTTNYSWASYNYPANNATNASLASNKLCGVQYLVSTAGAHNIMVSYDSRVSPTASDYERLQFTTNGTTWIDYPATSTFNGNSGSGNAGFYPFSYDLTGFPGVDNNPNFGLRVVTEFQSTATYGIVANNNYLGTANTYGTGGTVTYDLVTISGSAITNNATPPAISSIPNTNTPDYQNLTLNFTVTDSSTSPDALTYSATSLNPSTVYPGFNFGGSGVNRTLTIMPNEIPDQVDAAPILITVNDPNTGQSAATWFIVTVSSVNLAPTNSLTLIGSTNMLANSSITIPFSVSDDRTSTSDLTYATGSANNTLIPSGNIVINGQGTSNPSVTITPATNQLGAGQITVTVYDNDAQEPRSTTATIALMVRPNTNVIAIDYFDYDNSGPLDVVGTNVWNHLTGTIRQLQYNGANGSQPLLSGNGYAIVDTLDNTESLQAPLLGAPYSTNSSSVIYMSFLANMDPQKLPNANGSYFILFNDGSGATGPYSCRVMAATNGAAPGLYRLGVANTAANATNAQMFPMDLTPGSNYTVVASVVLSSGMSSLWVNPSAPSSQHVTDTSSVGGNLYNISDVELRETGANAGSVRVAKLKVGTTFDSVLPSLHVTTMGTNVIVTSSDPTLGIQGATQAAGPYSDVSASTPYTNRLTTNSVFYRFGQ